MTLQTLASEDASPKAIDRRKRYKQSKQGIQYMTEAMRELWTISLRYAYLACLATRGMRCITVGDATRRGYKRKMRLW